MKVSISWLKNYVPIEMDIADLAEAVFCANIRKGGWFAVAEAYQYWYDVSEDEVINMLRQ